MTEQDPLIRCLGLSEQERRKLVRFELDDLVDTLFRYDEETDEGLPDGLIQNVVAFGIMSIEDIIIHFGTRLVQRIQQ